MISFNSLSNLGRLGNQMFQFATIKGIAKHRQFDFCIPPSSLAGSIDINVKNSDATIYNTFNLDGVKYNTTNFPRVTEQTFNFDQRLFNECQDNVDLVGYFQNERYFEHIEQEIRKDFTFSEDIQTTCKNFLNGEEFISIHIRRGDYVENSNHPTQPLEYFQTALNLLNDTLPVLIFSDDPQWVKKQSLFSTDRFLVSDNNSTAIDLCLQTMCSYHIISNSSFSWWGSYLADSKKTIAPKNWFSGQLLTKDISGIYRKSWTII
jgi:hypothetical protein